MSEYKLFLYSVQFSAFPLQQIKDRKLKTLDSQHRHCFIFEYGFLLTSRDFKLEELRWVVLKLCIAWV